MENNFYNDDGFEHFLKDTTDNFKMYPSKKVWYSLYNDLHPSRRWPSLAVCFLLISAILFVGISNNNSLNKSTHSLSLNLPSIQKENNDAGLSAKKNLIAVSETNNQPGFIGENNFRALTHDNIKGSVVTADLKSISVTAVHEKETGLTGAGLFKSQTSTSEGYPLSKDLPDDKTAGSYNAEAVSKFKIVSGLSDQPGVESDFVKAEALQFEKHKDKRDLKAHQINAPAIILSQDERAWAEDYAFQHKHSISKLKSFGSMEYYATTSVGFRSLKKDKDFESLTADSRQLPVSVNAPNETLNINDQVTQKSALNIEAGAALLYSVSKRIRIKAGLQFNYTNYVSIADKLNHPTQTYLATRIEDNYLLIPGISNYANSIKGDKNQRLNNSTFQLSVPIGADFRIAGKNKLKWFAGTDIQPTFVTGGSVYAISSDSKNYIEEGSLLRQWNVNTSVSTFLSYKTSAGVTLMAGPQVRYQLFSTYNKQYNYTEKLYNIGLKLGVTKSF